MATGHERKVGGLLDGLLCGGTAAGLSDGQLLERFATGSGSVAELAFASIVERHGAMVLRVCEAVAGNRHDAEDAFQATFLVLVKKGRSLWVTDSLGPWLHQVALRTAHGARVAAARRRRHEDALATRAEAAGGAGEDHDDLVRIVHEEIGRLPDRYRVPVVLCDLEGQTQEQVAHHAGLPLGTVKSRLRRARERLRTRLTGRGLSPTIGAGAAVPVIPPGPDHPLPDALVRSTTAAALRATSLRTLAGTSAGLLAQGVISAMARSNWWKATAALLTAAATVSGAGLAAGKAPAAPRTQPPANQPPPKAKAEPQPRPKARPEPSSTDNVLTVEAKPERFQLSAKGNGMVEYASAYRVSTPLSGSLKPESRLADGTRVKKGELVAEFETSALRSQLEQQKLATLTAEAALQEARLAREAAEAAIKRPAEGAESEARREALEAVRLAKSEIERAGKRLQRTIQARDRVKEILARKNATPTPGDIASSVDLDDRVDAAQRDAEHAQSALDTADRKLAGIDRRVKEQDLRELRAAFAKARSTEAVREQACGIEKTEQVDLEDQIAKSRLIAPADGILSYAPGFFPDRVVKSQWLFTIYDNTSPLEIPVQFSGSIVDSVKPGQAAEIALEIQGRSVRTIPGIVHEVKERRDVSGGTSAIIRASGNASGFHLGTPANVKVVVAEVPDALTLPVHAVLSYDGKDHLAIKTPSGRIEWREVTLGVSDGSRVVIRSGLHPGDRVVLQPMSLLSQQERSDKGLLNLQ